MIESQLRPSTNQAISGPAKNAVQPNVVKKEQSQTARALPLVIARMVASAITIAIPLILARKLSLEEYGTYKQAFLLCSPLLSVLPFGVTQSLYFFVPRHERPRPYVLQTALFQAFVGILGGFALYMALPFAAHSFSNPALTSFQWELSLYVVFFLAAVALEPTLTSQGKTKLSAMVYVASELLKSAAMLVPVLLGYGLRGAMLGMAIFTFLRAIMAWVQALRVPGESVSFATFKEQLAYALPFGAAMLLNVPQQVSHQYAVSLVVSPEQFALYAAGCFQVPLVDLLYQPTSEVLMVRVGELDREGRHGAALSVFRSASARLVFFFVPIFAFFVAAAPAIVQTLFGTKFAGASPIFRVSVASVLLSCLPMDGLLRARNETRFLFRAYLIKTLVTLPLLLLGINVLGMYGAIWAWAAAELTGKAVLFSRLPKALGVSMRRFLSDGLPFAEVRWPVAASAAAGIFAAVLCPIATRHLYRVPHWSIIVCAISGVGFAAVWCLVLQLAGQKPIETLRDLLPKRGSRQSHPTANTGAAAEVAP